MHDFSLNLGGRLREFDTPVVMGILNVTDDSFFDGSRTPSPDTIAARVSSMVNAGVDIIDVGGCSTRPGFVAVSPDEEWRRVALGIEAVKNIDPEMLISVDTFRASVARQAIEAGAHVINDISAFTLDDDLLQAVVDCHVPYVLTHPSESRLTPDVTADDVAAIVIEDLSRLIDRLTSLGVADIIVDPGFGFGKTVDQNFELLARLDAFNVLQRPILVGVSRKSMIYRTIGGSPADALTGTVALNTFALLHGASILRVHDVAEARQIITLISKLNR